MLDNHKRLEDYIIHLCSNPHVGKLPRLLTTANRRPEVPSMPDEYAKL